MRALPLLAAGLLLVVGAAAHAQAPSVEEPGCLPVEDNGLVHATAAAVEPGQSLRLYFRWKDQGDFYWVAMEPDLGGRYWVTPPKVEKGIEQVEIYVALVDPGGSIVSQSESRLWKVSPDCGLKLTPSERGVAENLTVGETSPGQRGKKVRAFLCEGVVTRVDYKGIRHGDPICQACVVAWHAGDPALKAQPARQVEVFFGTDRAKELASVPEDHFGIRRSSGELHLGVCRVSVPREHRRGHLERPKLWKLQFSPDPNRHLLLQAVEDLDEAKFRQRMKSTLDRSKAKEMLVFVHGFDVSFSDAALRTAQLAYDLRLDGVPVLYSWPSQASLAPTDYMTDANNAEWTAPHLAKFLSGLADTSGARTIHLIAHSMGNKALTQALRLLAGTSPKGTKAPFDQILFTAPDVDAGVFEQIAESLRPTGKGLTLYASSEDWALQASQKAQKYPRAGEAGPGLVVLPGIDTIDVSAAETDFLGHSYYAESRAVLDDIFQLLRQRKSPGQRAHLTRKVKAGLAYWVLSPTQGE